jgi:hypothetical protein
MHDLGSLLLACIELTPAAIIIINPCKPYLLCVVDAVHSSAGAAAGVRAM